MLLRLKAKYPTVYADTSLLSTVNEGFERDPEVIPVIFIAEQLSIEIPLFDEDMVIDPCGYVLGGFLVVLKEKLIGELVEEVKMFVTVTV